MTILSTSYTFFSLFLTIYFCMLMLNENFRFVNHFYSCDATHTLYLNLLEKKLRNSPWGFMIYVLKSAKVLSTIPFGESMLKYHP
jgi:hypothetical protein